MHRLGAAAMAFAGCARGHLAVAGPRAARSTTEDIRVMALNMYHEARGEGELACSPSVGSCSTVWPTRPTPTTVTEVIYQGCQFSWVCDGRSDRPRVTSGPGAERVASSPRALLGGGMRDPTRGAMWYHAGLGPRSRLRPARRPGGAHRAARFLCRVDRRLPPSAGAAAPPVRQPLSGQRRADPAGTGQAAVRQRHHLPVAQYLARPRHEPTAADRVANRPGEPVCIHGPAIVVGHKNVRSRRSMSTWPR